MGFHPLDMMLIFVVALLIFGPKKLPEIGAQMGRTINAFKKGIREIRDPLSDSFDLEAFTAQQREIKALEARRLELEILERELAVKRAEAALKITQETGVVTYDSKTTVEADYDSGHYVESEVVVDADSITPEKIAHTSAEPVKTTESVKAAESVKTTEPIKTAESVSEDSALSKVSVKAE
jgi:TatA/E family protein of Tat protein translocase